MDARLASLSNVVDARIATRVAGRFLLEERIGAGATGVVYRALQEPLGRRVALKLLTSKDADDARRFAREARALAKLRHENIVVVHDVGEDEGTAFMAMEHIAGPTLRALLDDGPLAIAVVVELGKGIAGALAHAHKSSVIHRDLKPHNVMLAGDNKDAACVRVVDFGLARVVEIEGDTSDSVSVAIEGTPAYMAPEQIDVGKTNVPIGPACDVYALGVILYEALTGANPFRAETAFKTLLRHVEGRAPPPSVHRPDVPPWLDALVEQMLAKDPSARPSAVDVGARFSSPPPAHATIAPKEATEPMRPNRPAAPGRRLALGIVAVAAVAFTAIAARTFLGGDLVEAVHDGGMPTFVRQVGSTPVIAGVVDAGAAVLPVLLDAGSDARADVSPRRRRRAPVAAASAPVDAGSDAPAALVKRVRSLAGCAHPCADEVTARFDAAVAGDLEHLKAWRAELEACRAHCP
jgi:serine/threonine-protein kinase